MPTLLFKDFGLVKGVQFNSWRRVGGVVQSVKVYNTREVDELVFLDISATVDNRAPDFDLVDDIADECFMPLTVGGGVTKLDDVRRLLQVGADKVALNTAAVEHPELVTEASETFGAQCIVVSLDAKSTPSGGHEVYIRSGTVPTGREVVELAKDLEQRGAGEILLTSIDRDGTFKGYDIELIRRVAQAVTIPVIASGGAGTYEHMAEAVEAGASAVAAASMFHFTEQTPLEAKRHLRLRGFPTRA